MLNTIFPIFSFLLLPKFFEVPTSRSAKIFDYQNDSLDLQSKRMLAELFMTFHVKNHSSTRRNMQCQMPLCMLRSSDTPHVWPLCKLRTLPQGVSCIF